MPLVLHLTLILEQVVVLLTIKNPTVVGTATTQNLWNTTATTINFWWGRQQL